MAGRNDSFRGWLADKYPTEKLVDQSEYGEYPEKEFEFNRDCPGLVQ